MMKKKFNQIQIINKKVIFLTLLFILGLYHFLMCLIKADAFNLNEESITLFRHILTRFYHISTLSFMGIGLIWKFEKVYYWSFLYIGFRLLYNFITFNPDIKEVLNKSLLDGIFFGLLIIVILLIFANKGCYNDK